MKPRTLEESLAFSRALLEPCEVDTTVPAWREAEEAGWDMWQLRDALSQPVAVRMREHDRALRQIEAMRATFLKHHGQFGNAA